MRPEACFKTPKVLLLQKNKEKMESFSLEHNSYAKILTKKNDLYKVGEHFFLLDATKQLGSQKML